MKISYSLWFPSHLIVVLILLKFQMCVYNNIPARFKLMSLKVWENSSVTTTLTQLERNCPWFSLITLSSRNRLFDLQKYSVFSSSDDFCRPSEFPSRSPCTACMKHAAIFLFSQGHQEKQTGKRVELFLCSLRIFFFLKSWILSLAGRRTNDFIFHPGKSD